MVWHQSTKSHPAIATSDVGGASAPPVGFRSSPPESAASAQWGSISLFGGAGDDASLESIPKIYAAERTRYGQIPKKQKPRLRNANGAFSREGGIRTPDTLAGITDFESVAFDHSATSLCRNRARRGRLGTALRGRKGSRRGCKRASAGQEKSLTRRCGWRRGLIGGCCALGAV